MRSCIVCEKGRLRVENIEDAVWKRKKAAPVLKLSVNVSACTS